MVDKSFLYAVLSGWLVGTTLVTAGVSQERNEASEVSVQAPQRVVRVAAVSFVPVKFDLEANSNRLEQWFRKVK